MTRQERIFLFAQLVLCATLACSLSYTVQGSFNMSEELRSNITFTALLCALLQALLTWGTRNPTRKPLGYALFLAACVFLCGGAALASPASNPIADIPENAFTGMVSICAVNLAVHALSRSAARSVALFGASAFTCGLVQFLYTTNALVAALVSILAALVLLGLMSNRGVFVADGTNQELGASAPLRLKAGVTCAVIPLAACLLSCAVVFGAIMPLNPPHATVKIFTIYLAYEENNVKTGVELDSSASASATSNSIDDSLKGRSTTDKRIDANATQTAESEANTSGEAKDYLSNKYSDVDISGGLDGLRSLALNPSIPWPLIIALVLALLALAFTVPRYLVHRRRLARIIKHSPDAQVRLLYAFFLDRFRLLGIGKPPELSPVEYANLYRQRIYPYAGAQEAGSFDHLTALFVWSGFGGVQPTQQDLNCMHELYWDFYRRCKKELGLFKYGIKHIRL